MNLIDHFDDKYRSINDVVDEIIRETRRAQGGSIDTIPIQAIDEAAMPNMLKEPDEISQQRWDRIRDELSAEVAARGFYVD